MTFCNQQRSTWLLVLAAVAACILFYALVYHAFFSSFERMETTPPYDWRKQVEYYQAIRSQWFELKQVPHLYSFNNWKFDYLLANPETATLSPLNLLLPLFSLKNLFIVQFTVYYSTAIWAFLLLRRKFSLPFFSVPLMFVLFGLNGRILSNLFVGHSMFVTYMCLPLLLYMYMSGTSSRIKTYPAAFSFAAVLTLMFFEGGAHIVIWMFLMLTLDVVMVACKAVFDCIRFRHRLFGQDCYPVHFLFFVIGLFVLLSAVKLMPAFLAYMDYAPSFSHGYQNLLKFLECFYTPGMMAKANLAVVRVEEGCNYIGTVGFVLGVLAVLYAVFLQSSWQVRRLGLLALLFVLFSFNSVYADIFGDIPVLCAERVLGRFVFITLGILALLIPLFLARLMRGLHSATREVIMLTISFVIFLQLYSDARAWFWFKPTDTSQTVRELFFQPLSKAPEIYALFFQSGLLISITTLLVIMAQSLRER